MLFAEDTRVGCSPLNDRVYLLCPNIRTEGVYLWSGSLSQHSIYMYCVYAFCSVDWGSYTLLHFNPSHHPHTPWWFEQPVPRFCRSHIVHVNVFDGLYAGYRQLFSASHFKMASNRLRSIDFFYNMIWSKELSPSVCAIPGFSTYSLVWLRRGGGELLAHILESVWP